MMDTYRQEERHFHWHLLDGSWYWWGFLGGSLVLAVATYPCLESVDLAVRGIILAVLLLLQSLMDIRYGLLYDRLNLVIACGALLPVIGGRVTGSDAVLEACLEAACCGFCAV